MDCIKKKRVVVLRSGPPQNVKLSSFTSLSCIEGKEMYQKALCTSINKWNPTLLPHSFRISYIDKWYPFRALDSL